MHTCNHHELCQMFRRSAEWTYRKMTEAEQFDSPFNEETITENILLDLKKHRSASLKIQSYNKHQESKTGADWIFVFSQNGYEDISVLVQAKRLYSKDGKYNAFEIEDNQFDILEKKANDIKSVEKPIYVLYNNYKKLEKFQIPSYVHKSKNFFYFIRGNCPNHDVKKYLDHWGCAVATVDAMRNAGNKPSPEKIKPMFPWHMLFHSYEISNQNINSKQNYSLPDTVSQSLRWMQNNIGRDAYEFIMESDMEGDKDRELDKKTPAFMSFLKDGEFEKLYKWMEMNEIKGLIHFNQSGE